VEVEAVAEQRLARSEVKSFVIYIVVNAINLTIDRHFLLSWVPSRKELSKKQIDRQTNILQMLTNIFTLHAYNNRTYILINTFN
jgi:hypothetical protein